MTITAKITAQDSFYKAVIGEVVARKAGWVQINATQVMDKWSKTFEQHPTSCIVWAKEADVVA